MNKVCKKKIIKKKKKTMAKEKMIRIKKSNLFLQLIYQMGIIVILFILFLMCIIIFSAEYNAVENSEYGIEYNSGTVSSIVSNIESKLEGMPGRGSPLDNLTESLLASKLGALPVEVANQFNEDLCGVEGDRFTSKPIYEKMLTDQLADEFYQTSFINFKPGEMRFGNLRRNSVRFSHLISEGSGKTFIDGYTFRPTNNPSAPYTLLSDKDAIELATVEAFVEYPVEESDVFLEKIKSGLNIFLRAVRFPYEFSTVDGCRNEFIQNRVEEILKNEDDIFDAALNENSNILKKIRENIKEANPNFDSLYVTVKDKVKYLETIVNNLGEIKNTREVKLPFYVRKEDEAFIPKNYNTERVFFRKKSCTGDYILTKQKKLFDMYFYSMNNILQIQGLENTRFYAPNNRSPMTADVYYDYIVQSIQKQALKKGNLEMMNSPKKQVEFYTPKYILELFKTNSENTWGLYAKTRFSDLLEKEHSTNFPEIIKNNINVYLYNVKAVSELTLETNCPEMILNAYQVLSERVLLEVQAKNQISEEIFRMEQRTSHLKAQADMARFPKEF